MQSVALGLSASVCVLCRCSRELRSHELSGSIARLDCGVQLLGSRVTRTGETMTALGITIKVMRDTVISQLLLWRKEKRRMRVGCESPCDASAFDRACCALCALCCAPNPACAVGSENPGNVSSAPKCSCMGMATFVGDAKRESGIP